MKKDKKYIVYESYMFGNNYYDNTLQCVPDYQITDKIPEVSETVMKILLERKPGLIVKEAK